MSKKILKIEKFLIIIKTKKKSDRVKGRLNRS